MKINSRALLACFVPFAFGLAAFAGNVTVQLDNVHLCCNSCVQRVDKTIATVPGAAAVANKENDTVAITAADKATAQKAVNALVAAGYFGVSLNPAVKVEAASGAKNKKVQSLEVGGVHLCCRSCVNAVNEVLGKVPGVTGTTAAKDVASFQVKGEFNDKAAFDALNEAGLAGRVSTAK